MISFKNSLVGLAFVAVAATGSAVGAQSDPFLERLRTNPTAIPRPHASGMPPESEVTRSLRAQVRPSQTPYCSYDASYWNTIYACDPARQGLPQYEGRERGGQGD